MLTEKPKSYITVPRYILEDYLDKKLTRSEFILCVWIRCGADINGFTTTNVTSLRNDMFPDVKVNTVQKLLLSLRKKKYLHFPSHQGRRGSIRIESDTWLMKTKGTKSIAHHFNQNEIISDGIPVSESTAEPEQNLDGQNQKFIEQKEELTKGFSNFGESSRFRSHYNEYNNKKEKNTVGATFKGTLTKDFNPTNSDEKRLKEIALELGDEYVNSLLNILRKNKRGLWAMEKALEVVQMHIEMGKPINNRPAYFHGIVKQILLKEI